MNRSDWMKLDSDERDGRDSSVDSVKYRDREWLEEKYHCENLLMGDIADICGCAMSTIDHWIDKHNIDRKKQSEIQGNSKDTRYQDADWLRQKYHEEELSETEIGKLCGVDQCTIDKWMKRNNIKTRSRSERQSLSMTEKRKEQQSKKMSGENHPLYGKTGKDHPAYTGGYDGDFRLTNKWQRTRGKVYKRDNYTCQKCGDSNVEVHAHHIKHVADGGKKYNLDNIETLCRDCHIEHHSNGGEE